MNDQFRNRLYTQRVFNWQCPVVRTHFLQLFGLNRWTQLLRARLIKSRVFKLCLKSQPETLTHC